MRWSLFGFKGESGPCEVCGGETVAERRRPDVTAHRLRVERRELVLHGEPAETGSRFSA